MQPDPLPSSSPSAAFANRAVISVPLVVEPNISLRDAIARLHKTTDGCVLITEQQHPIGIFTERDLVRLIAADNDALSQPISAVMTHPVETISSVNITNADDIFQQMQALDVRYLPVVNHQGVLVGLITQSSLLQALNSIRISDDISDRERIELEQEQTTPDLQAVYEKLDETNDMEKIRGKFVAMVSHELRTPLTSIHGALRLLNQDIVPLNTEEGARLLQVATESSERLVKLVRDILALESLKSGKQELYKQPIDSQDFLNRVVDSFMVTARKKDIGFEVIGDRLDIVVDSDRLYQVYVNLIDNAVKFSSRGATIQLTVTAEDDTALFSVCDEGIGISAKQCEKIFERFFQGEHNNENVKGGTGLGLTICQNIIEQHGGTIWVESSVGQGSCFYFRLPSKVEYANSM